MILDREQGKRWRVAGLAALALLLMAGAGAESSRAALPSFSTLPALSPDFAWSRSDYVVRCDSSPVKVTTLAAAGWRSRVGNGGYRADGFVSSRRLLSGRSLNVTFSRGGKSRVFHLRCLPADFPDYQLSGPWTGTPRLTMVQLLNGYAAAFDRHGAPVWWMKTPEGDPVDAKFLPDGTFVYTPVKGVSFRRFVVRSIRGRKLRLITAGRGLGSDSHDLRLLPNGNYLIGAHRLVRGVDTSRFGGRTKSTIDTAQVQEITPAGRVVWSWNAYPRIGLRETGRWWETLAVFGQPYDVNHWNSIDRRGQRILLSFRHLDAVYCIDRRSGKILWKLGGTPTARSLEVHGDERGSYPLGGQHDARFAADGSITVLDNATYLEPGQPRAVRYRINAARGTATLIDEVTDPLLTYSIGFGSARLDPEGNWFVGWGAMLDGTIGSYPADGGEPSRLLTPGGASYRASPVTGGRPTVAALRQAMDDRVRSAGAAASG